MSTGRGAAARRAPAAQRTAARQRVKVELQVNVHVAVAQRLVHEDVVLDARRAPVDELGEEEQHHDHGRGERDRGARGGLDQHVLLALAEGVKAAEEGHSGGDISVVGAQAFASSLVLSVRKRGAQCYAVVRLETLTRAKKNASMLAPFLYLIFSPAPRCCSRAMSYGGGAKCAACTKPVYAADPKVFVPRRARAPPNQPLPLSRATNRHFPAAAKPTARPGTAPAFAASSARAKSRSPSGRS